MQTMMIIFWIAFICVSVGVCVFVCRKKLWICKKKVLISHVSNTKTLTKQKLLYINNNNNCKYRSPSEWIHPSLHKVMLYHINTASSYNCAKTWRIYYLIFYACVCLFTCIIIIITTIIPLHFMDYII